MKRIFKSIIAIALCMTAMTAHAQYTADAPNGTLSPYSQMGVGVLSDPQTGFNAGMGGVGIGMRKGNEANTLNPASYSAVDSLSFIFDAGISGHMTNFEQNAKKINRYSASLDYVTAIFRLRKGLGMSFGIQPYSQIGYDYSEQGYVDESHTLTYTNSYHSRQSGIQQYFIGLGWAPVKYVSIGANIGYLHGEIDRTVSNTFSDSNIDTYVKNYLAEIGSYKLDFGVQVNVPLSKKDQITVGATYGLGHDLGADQTLNYYHTTSSTGVTDTTNYVAKNAFAIPNSFGVGFSYSHDRKWRIGADYSTQLWNALTYPVFKETVSGEKRFVMSNNYFMDRQRINVGGEYCANETGRNFFGRIRYRLGGSYTSSYYKLGNADGPREISVSAGLAIPIVNGYNNRSVLNISAQWANTEATGFIKENSFRIKIGFTFNERWFMKWKVE